jgi:aerobic C4-dicarboxylate transport protein
VLSALGSSTDVSTFIPCPGPTRKARTVPTTSFDALARNDVLQVLCFAVLFGVSLALVGDAGAPVTALIERVSTVLFKMMSLIVRLAPLGVLGAVGYTVGRYGVGSLKQLISLR